MRLYNKFSGDVGVSSSLMALKDTGEGEGRVTFPDACGAVVHINADYLDALEDQKLPSGED